MTTTDGRTSAAVTPRPAILSWRRLLSCLAAGLVAAGVTVLAGAPELSALVGWVVAAAGLLTWVWRISWPRDADGTKRLAEEEGRSRVTDTVVLCAAVVSLGAVAEALVRSGSQDAVGVATVVLGVAVAVLSWALVNTVFALSTPAGTAPVVTAGSTSARRSRPPTATSPTSRSPWT
nr:DUF1345 domain-containing protein [Modestobacter sp. L9-4]